MERIKTAVEDLYGSYDVLSEDMKQFVEKAIIDGKYEETFSRVRRAEAENKENLLEYQEQKPGTINGDNISDLQTKGL